MEMTKKWEIRNNDLKMEKQKKLTIGVKSLDRGEDVSKVRVTEVGMDLDVILNTRGGESERVNGPGEVVVPVGLSERKTLSDSGLVDLDSLDTGVGEVNDLVSEGKSKLLRLNLLGDIGSGEGPVKDLGKQLATRS